MSKAMRKDEIFNQGDVQKQEANRELQRNIVVGAILRSIHKKEGTMPYLIQLIEPYLTKEKRKLFGLPF